MQRTRVRGLVEVAMLVSMVTAAASAAAEEGDASSVPAPSDQAVSTEPAAAPLPAPSAAVACVPSCRSGFTCVQGQCVSACNPPCPPNQVCSGQGVCQTPAGATEWAPVSSPADTGETGDENTPPSSTRLRSVGMLVTGIVLGGVGASSLAAGLLYHLMADASPCDSRSSTSMYGSTCLEDEYRTVGNVMLVLGGVLVAVGIPLIVVGAKRVPANSTAVLAPPSPTVRLGMGPGSLVLGATW